MSEYLAPPEAIVAPRTNLLITVYRHGPKVGFTGPLKEDEKENIETIFLASVPRDVDQVVIFHSQIRRSKETAELRRKVLENNGIEAVDLVGSTYLSEGGIMHNPDLVEELGGLGGKWYASWRKQAQVDSMKPDNDSINPARIKSGKDVVRDMCLWLTEVLEDHLQVEKKIEVDAFSHAPVIGAFLQELEEYTGEDLISGYADGDDSKIISDDILPPLSQFTLTTSDGENLTLRFRESAASFNISILNKMILGAIQPAI